MRAGFKQTEVGVIPEEWDVRCLREVTEDQRPISYGIVQTGPNIPDGIPCLRVVDIDNGHIGKLDLIRTTKYISDSYRRTTLRRGDLVMPLRGKVGDVGEIDDELEGANLTRGVALLAIRPEFSGPYCRNALSWSATRRRLEQSMNGSALQEIPIATLRAFQIGMPETIAEQCAIASVLNAVDALLGGLDRLIAKKLDLKQAAMQQLLTGRTRLPGFHGEWEVKRLGDHMVLLRNGVNSRAELLPEGRVSYIHYGDVHACKNVFMSPASLPCLPDAKAASLERLRDGDLIFADASEDVAGVSKSVELRGVGRTEVVSGLHTIAARFDTAVLADGFKGYLQFCPPFAMHLRRLAAGTKVYATNRTHVASVEMRLPPVAEQTAIAAILSDMDAEQSALEARRDKTRALKQGMMQDLLTGKTRLVPTGVARA